MGVSALDVAVGINRKQGVMDGLKEWGIKDVVTAAGDYSYACLLYTSSKAWYLHRGSTPAPETEIITASPQQAIGPMQSGFWKMGASCRAMWSGLSLIHI